MITFKQFLTEGGKATAQFHTDRATQADVHAAVKFVAKALGIGEETIKAGLLGTTQLTALGKKESSGDVDIALHSKDFDHGEINKKMLAACGGEGKFNGGTDVGSYAVPVGEKKIQVDLMFVSDMDWAKFIYHSAHGAGSKYPGAVRNIILFTALAHTQKPGEDFALRDKDGKVIARASQSIRLNTGMERMFKLALQNKKTGERKATLDRVTPEQLDAELKKLGKDNIKYARESKRTTNPNEVVSYIFGPNVKPADVMTAEQVIAHIKKLKNAEQILRACKSELAKAKLPIPEGL